jgi:hypothetical protein
MKYVPYAGARFVMMFALHLGWGGGEGVLTESFRARFSSFSVFFALVLIVSSSCEMRKANARNTA